MKQKYKVGDGSEVIAYNWGPPLVRDRVSDELIQDLTKRVDDSIINKETHLAGNLKKQLLLPEAHQAWLMRELLPNLRKYLEFIQFHWLGRNDGKAEELIDAYMSGLVLEEVWVNWMVAGDYNPAHIHTTDISWVLYLDVPEVIYEEHNDYKGTGGGPGIIEFSYGEFGLDHTTIARQSLKPKTGDFIIFPSKLAHMVLPFKTPDIERITVAGNMKVYRTDAINRTLAEGLWKYDDD